MSNIHHLPPHVTMGAAGRLEIVEYLCGVLRNALKHQSLSVAVGDMVRAIDNLNENEQLYIYMEKVDVEVIEMALNAHSELYSDFASYYPNSEPTPCWPEDD